MRHDGVSFRFQMLNRGLRVIYYTRLFGKSKVRFSTVHDEGFSISLRDRFSDSGFWVCPDTDTSAHLKSAFRLQLLHFAYNFSERVSDLFIAQRICQLIR